MAFGQSVGELAPCIDENDPEGTAVRHVVVVGAGIAGLACALACALAGARVDVLEARSWNAPVPAHIDLVPNLLRDLARLGVAEACLQRGFAYSGVAIVDEHGREVVLLPTPHLAGAHLPAAAGIAHDDLVDTLGRAAVQAGVTVHAGVAVRSVDAARGRALTEGGRTYEADLLLLASGAQSPLAAALFDEVPTVASEHGWWHVLMPRPAWLQRATWMAGSPGRRLYAVPVDITRAGIAVVADTPLPEHTDAGALALLLKRWGTLPQRLGAALGPGCPTTFRRVTSALRAAPWHRGAVLCVGATAHAFAPPFGQSAAQALEDAVVLRELLATAPARAPLLQAFGARRVARAQQLHALVEQGARWLARPEPDTDLQQLAHRIDELVARPA